MVNITWSSLCSDVSKYPVSMQPENRMLAPCHGSGTVSEAVEPYRTFGNGHAVD